MKKIAFQGRKGAYSDCAAHYLFGEDIETLPMDTFEEIYQAIETGEADGGAIPIENSTAGSIEANYDLLYKWRHRIVGEVMLRIEHTLCVMPGVKLADLKRVYSHPQALAQCSKFFAENPQIKAVPAFDTAGSAEELAARKAKDEGAIASAYAAKIYNLDILKAGLENLKGTNFTRFYGIQKVPAACALQCARMLRQARHQLDPLRKQAAPGQTVGIHFSRILRSKRKRRTRPGRPRRAQELYEPDVHPGHIQEGRD